MGDHIILSAHPGFITFNLGETNFIVPAQYFVPADHFLILAQHYVPAYHFLIPADHFLIPAHPFIFVFIYVFF